VVRAREVLPQALVDIDEANEQIGKRGFWLTFSKSKKPLFQNQFKIQMQSIQNLFSTGFIFHGTSYDKLSFPQLFSLCVLQSVVF
jgi:hypothetical protein